MTTLKKTWASGQTGHVAEHNEIASRLYNVKDWGAAGNGVADDAEAIQDAIDAAYAAGGGSVFLPAGMYLLTTSLVLKKSVSIRGVFPGATPGYVDWWSLSSVVSSGTVITYPGGTVFTNDLTPGIGSASGVDGVIIESLGFNNVGSVVTVGDTNKDGLNGCIIRDLLFSNVTGIALDLTNSNLCNVQNIKGFFIHRLLRFTCDEDTAVVNNNCGNSVFIDLYADIAASGNPYPSIHLRTIDRNGNGAHLGSVQFIHPQINRMKGGSSKVGKHLSIEGASATSQVIGASVDYWDFEGVADARINIAYANGTTIDNGYGANGQSLVNTDFYIRNSANTRITSSDASPRLDMDSTCFPTYYSGFLYGVLGGGVYPLGVYVVNSVLHMGPLPTSAAGLQAGDLWNDGGTVKIVTA